MNRPLKSNESVPHADRRRHSRQTVQLPATVDLLDGQPPSQCVVTEISALGARISLQNPAQLPDEFVLRFGPSGGPSRKCRLVWRGNEHVGVEFDRPRYGQLRT
jgi:hypothetical protein